ncbi:glycosyltransferase family 2 protein [Baekduia soli]|uniref:Glycosyltransferase family 2 protein n=1 Tax=Baekduia soli TaxID=496014 RepID=A0A5B8TZP4_9ACTN|nr:glycosyltransferase family 2 protein [Baekduia soli]QEC46192.1 glycosyltransferase family 2 protein [Baekduia soli]
MSAVMVADERAAARAPAVGPAARRSRVIVLIPARNEELGIVAAMESVEAQTRKPDRRIVISDNSTDGTVERARSRPGWEVWETVGNRGRKGGALNQAWAILEPTLSDADFVLTMDADTILDPHFIENARLKYLQEESNGLLLGGVCANFSGLPLNTALGALQMMEYARATKINRSRRGTAPVLAGAATMLSVQALRSVYRERGHLYEPVLTEDYELSLVLRAHGYVTLAPSACRARTDLMPTMSALWAQRLRWYRGAFEALRAHGFEPGIRSDIAWLAFSLWAAASRWLFLIALAATAITVGHMTFSPWLLLLFALASLLRVIQVSELGWKYMVLAGLMVEELYYALFLEAVLWRSFYLACTQRSAHW